MLTVELVATRLRDLYGIELCRTHQELIRAEGVSESVLSRIWRESRRDQQPADMLQQLEAAREKVSG